MYSYTVVANGVDKEMLLLITDIANVDHLSTDKWYDICNSKNYTSGTRPCTVLQARGGPFKVRQ